MGAVVAATTVVQSALTASGRHGPALSSFPPFPRPPRTGFIDLEELPVIFLRGGRVRVGRTIEFHDDTLGVCVIPRHFVSDGTSSPPVTWPFIGHPYSYSLLPASLLHDAELAFALRARHDGAPHLARRAIDALYYRALRAWGVGSVRAGLIFLAVRFKAIVLGRDFAASGVSQ